MGNINLLRKALRELKNTVQKAKGLPVGTKRMWSGKPYVKTNEGWRPEKSQKQPAEKPQTTQKPTQQEPMQPSPQQQKIHAKRKAWTAMDNPKSDLNKLIGQMQKYSNKKNTKMAEALEQEIKNFGKKKGYDEGAIGNAIITAKRQRQQEGFRKKWSNE